MIKEKEINIKPVYKNIKRFHDLGYKCELNDIILVKIEDLSKNSHIKITAICDKCGHESIISYQDYNENFSKYNIYTCLKCSHLKNKLTNKEKYNDENYTNKEKTKITNLKKYGVDNVFKSKEIKNKIKKTNNKKYGVDYPQQNKTILNKSIETNNKKYNCDRPSQNSTVVEKMKNTKKEKYNDSGYNNILKIKKTNLEKYNVENVSQLIGHKEKIQKKSASKILTKYLFIKNVDYINNKYFGVCKKNHNYEINIDLFHNRLSHDINPCTICYPENSLSSDKENQLLDFIKENYSGNIISKDRKILEGKEIDIFLPDLKLGFEFNGIYWHSKYINNKKYHYNKTEMCEQKNIHLIHIFDDDWTYKNDIIKSRILNLIDKTPNSLYAKKCIIKEIHESEIIRNFLKENHLQGFVRSQIKLGLYYNDELVSLMILGKQKKSKGSNNTDNIYELLRICNKININVIGGSSKLFKYFIDNYNPVEVISYANRSWSQGELCKELGFTFVNKTPPNYYYVIDRIKTQKIRKDMLERKIYKIYDSGNLKYKINLKNV